MSGDTGRNKMEVEMLQGFDLKVASATLHQPLHVHLCQNKHAAGTHFVCVCVCVCVCVFVLTLLEGLRMEDVVHCADCKTD